MGIKVIFIPLALLIVPLDRETQHAIDFAASILDVLTDLAVSHIACICPTETIRPLKHRRRSLILRSNQRHHILLETILHEQLQPSRSRQHVFDKLVDTNFFCTAKLLGINRNSLSHCLKRICSANHTRSCITVAEQNIISSDIVQSSKPTTQTAHIAKLGDSLLCIFQHLLSENGLWTLIVCGSNNFLKSSNSRIHIHTFAQIYQQSPDSGVTDTKLSHIAPRRCQPNISGLVLIRSIVVFDLVSLKDLDGVFKFLAAIQTILCNQLQNSINSIHGQFFQRTLVYVCRITPLSHLGSHIIRPHNEALRNLDCEMIPSIYILVVFIILVVHHSAEHIARTNHIAADKIRIHNIATFHIGSQSVHNWLILSGLSIEIPNRNQITTRIKRYQLADILHKTAAAGTIILTTLTEQLIRTSREAVEIQIVQFILVCICNKQWILDLHHLIEVILQQCTKFLEIRHYYHSPFKYCFLCPVLYS